MAAVMQIGKPCLRRFAQLAINVQHGNARFGQSKGLESLSYRRADPPVPETHCRWPDRWRRKRVRSAASTLTRRHFRMRIQSCNGIGACGWVPRQLMAKESVTSEDVARLAQVSQSAVSRTFTPGASVSEKTRGRVLEAAKQLGYRPNALARAMISGRSRLIAVLVAYLDNQFYPIVLEHLTKSLQARGYQVLLFMTEPGRQDETVLKMLQFQVEGIVMASATMSSNLARECAATGIPVVLFNRYIPSVPTSSVTSDNREGGRLLARLLAAARHRRIAFIAGAEDSSTNKDRELGFNEGLKGEGISLWAREVGDYKFDTAARAARNLLKRPQPPDAVFVANDHMAFSVIDVIRDEFALRIPDDISIVGYDDVPEAGWGGYKLTTVRQDSQAMIDETVAILMKQIEHKKVRKQNAVLPAALVIRATCRLPEPDRLAEIAGS
ncbi:MAG: LacI family DNA-binding transcriptional regulator [Rhizobiaceae bacterium]